jgi:hypothetical protein
MPLPKPQNQSESWHKWLLSIFLLCFFQGWLLSQASVLVGLSFLILTLPVVVIIAFAKTGTTAQQIFSKPILTCWSGVIAWTMAGSISDFWLGVVNGQVAMAVGVTMLIASAIAWAWVIAAIEIGDNVFSRLSGAKKFAILAICSWLGLALGWVAHTAT